MSNQTPDFWTRLSAVAHPAYLVALTLISVTGIVVGIQGRVTRLEEEKASRAEVKAELRAIESVLERLDLRTQRVDRYICRQVPGDLGCP